MMRILYYFLKNIKTGEEVLKITDEFLGDIGEYVIVHDIEYIITDYSEEIKG